MNRRAIVLSTAGLAAAAFAGATFVYNRDQARQAEARARAAADALIRDHAPILGPANAPVTIVEFFDPACEACRAFHPALKQILGLFPGEVRLVIRYAPFHKGSDVAVGILEAARRQGRFAEILEALLARQPEWADHAAPDLSKAWAAAGAAGLDLERARRDAAQPEIATLLRADMADIATLGVQRTPTFFVNGKPLREFGPRPLFELVKSEVEAARPR